jgi:Fe-S-cluster containining protein
MQPINLPAFKKKVERNKKRLRIFLSGIKKRPPKNLDAAAVNIDKDIWLETDCLTCGNCCKTMTPTFTKIDIKRISSHFDMTIRTFKSKWLKYNKKDKDWVNISTPCQFLEKKTNMCSIYDIRPSDCSEFPHLTKKKMVDYIHVHKQNLTYCPATYKMVEKMNVLFNS